MPRQWVALLLATTVLATTTTPAASQDAAYVLVLGIGQDAGYPQAGTKEHPAWDDASLQRHAACLAVVDPASNERYLIEATPDFKEQLHRLDVAAPHPGRPGLDGIFLTHGHMGHYTGLMHLGREAIGASEVPVYAMPRMRTFLSENGPWDQLVRLKNIVLRPLTDREPIRLNERLTVTPVQVPHRDEYTETVGYVIRGPRRAVLFIPDIDKWKKWDVLGERIEDWIAQVDVAYLDGSFFADGEIPGRDMAEIPHPFMTETMQRFASLSAVEKAKVRFIHLNRTNPALVPGSAALQAIADAGFRVARELERIEL